MFISLTSAKEEIAGKTIVLNTEHILSIFREDVVGENNLTTEKTFIFCPPHGTWEVAETPEEILDLINSRNK